MKNKNENNLQLPSYSFSPAPDNIIENTIKYNSDTEFSWAISGKNPDTVWPIIDEMMTVLRMTQPRLYNGVMQKLQE